MYIRPKQVCLCQIVIVGESALTDVRSMYNNNTKVMCFPNDMVSDMTEKILSFAAENKTLKDLFWS